MNEQAPSNRNETPKHRRLLFGVAASLLPFLLIAAIEVTLRLAGWEARSQQPFVELDERHGYVHFNPAYLQRYFRDFTPSVAPDVFRSEKPEGSMRLFVLGGSTVAGYPYMFQTAFPARLQQRLERLLFGRRVEVINLGMTAVNTYTLWDLKEAVANQEPDAVLIYAGHNEYYGAFGAGSTIYDLGNKVRLKRPVLFLKRSAIFRSMERLLFGWGGRGGSSSIDQTMMSRVVGDRGIDWESDTYHAGVDQFRMNLGSVVSYFTDRGIPVLLGTLASNLADQAPLGSSAEARSYFEMGRELAASGEFADARRAFIKARDHDDVRFRAPSTFNAVIVEIAERPGVMLVETEREIRTASGHGIEGADLFVDHLHPNVTGYGIMAETFAEAVTSLMGTDAPALNQIGKGYGGPDPIDSAVADINIERLKSSFPFANSDSPEAEAGSLKDLVNAKLSGSKYDSLAMLVLMNRIPPPAALALAKREALADHDTTTALLLLRSIMQWRPLEVRPAIEAAQLASDTKRFDRILSSIILTAVHRTDDDRFLNLLGAVAVRQSFLEDAEVVLSLAESRNPDDHAMLYNQARLHLLLGDTVAARGYYERFRSLRGGKAE